MLLSVFLYAFFVFIAVFFTIFQYLFFIVLIIFFFLLQIMIFVLFITLLLCSLASSVVINGLTILRVAPGCSIYYLSLFLASDEFSHFQYLLRSDQNYPNLHCLL